MSRKKKAGSKRRSFNRDSAFTDLSLGIGCKPGGFSEGCKRCCALITCCRLAGKKDKSSRYGHILKTKKDGGYHREWNGGILHNVVEAKAKLKRTKEPTRFMLSYTSDCSMWPQDYFDTTVSWAHKYPQHTFTFLSKNPRRMLRKLSKSAQRLGVPGNVEIGTSVENEETKWRIDEIRNFPFFLKRVWFAPLLGEVGKLNLKGIYAIHITPEASANARECDPLWIIKIAKQTRKQRVKSEYHPAYKKIGAMRHMTACRKNSPQHKEYPLSLRKFNKLMKK